MTGTALVGDVGGTYLRLGLSRGPSTEVTATATMQCDAFPDLETALRGYLDGFPAVERPRRACLAVAAPVEGDDVSLTNNGFAFSISQLRDGLGLDVLHVVNDLAAVARGVRDLEDSACRSLANGGIDRSRPVAVVAPGTGLGVAALIPSPAGPIVLPGEGGQVPVPCTPGSAAVVAALRSQGRAACAEDLVGGSGLPLLDLLLRSVGGEPDPVRRSAALISGSGETAPGQVLDVFVELLAAVAQTAALLLGARGGVVLGGGFLHDLVPVLRTCRFVERFQQHPKLPDYLGAIPLVVDTRPHPALVGAAGFARDTP